MSENGTRPAPPHALSRLLHPRSVAVLGGLWAANTIEQLDRLGFDGPVWPVHPTRDTLGGHACMRTLADLPSAPDAVFLGMNRDATIDCVRELAAMGAGGAVCFASGFAEAGSADRQQALVDAASGMPLLGPNCYGLIDYLDGVALWPDQHGGQRVARGVAIVSQSSNIAINLTMQRRGLPVGYVACLGNAAVTSLADLGEALLTDPRITALGLYIEGIGDARALAALAAHARAAGKGIVALKGGRTAQGEAAAATHTAALAGDGRASSAFLAQAGIGEVHTPEALIETLKILHVHGPLNARRWCAAACSGGEAGLVADLAHDVLDLPAPTDAQRERLARTLGAHVTLANPLDYHTDVWGDETATAEVFAALLDGYDAGLFVIDRPRGDRCDPATFDPACRAIERAACQTGRPAFAVSALPESVGEAEAEVAMARGAVPLCGLDTSIRSVAAAATPAGVSQWRPWPVDYPFADDAISTDDEASAKACLRGAGVAVPRFVVGDTIAAVADAATELRPPFALKGLGVLHKTEAAAVRLHLHRLDDLAPMAGVSGYLVEEMVTGTVAELLVGLRRDPCYGATLTLGIGGTAVELLDDTVTLIAPVSADDVHAALRRLRLWPLLDGHRGRERADVSAAVDAVLSVQALFERETLVEVEINPLMLRTAGAVAADAIIRRVAP